jgi:two-component system LytT family response regulator
MLKAVIIEDELRARRILEAMLTEHCPQVTILDQAEDVASGVLSIKKHQPDLVFLDIEMPGMDGFKLFEFFDETNFEVIFTTAYNDYALRAFEVSAIHYLLKPIQIDLLIAAVNKAEKVIRSGNANFKGRAEVLTDNLKEKTNIKKLALPLADGFMFVTLDEIIYLMADGSYTNIYLTNGTKLLVTRYLKDFVELINQPTFYKPHRSYYINLNHIRQYVKQEGGHIVMSNGDIVHISRDNKEDFLANIQHRILE